MPSGLLFAQLSVHSSVGTQQAVESQTDAEGGPTLLVTEHLPNVVRVHDKVISGGLPEGEAAFQELARLGIKTIISVDGMRPDAESADKLGMRYVHLPHGYDGIPSQRIAELAKAVRELEGPIYIHCHHGKHRSPAAASSACIAAGMIDTKTGTQVLKVAGTGANYRGLFAVVAQQRPLPVEYLEGLQVDYRQVVPVPPMAEAMVDIEHAFANLQKLAKNEWLALPNRPNLVASHEATLLEEHLKELRWTPEAQQQSSEFHEILQNSERLATSILEEITRSDVVRTQEWRRQLDKLLDGIGSDCRVCHQVYRDNR
jgi:protein tyrosine phosphatase (PTP) superfamily phosphohydrolase (DUF442 family)